MAGRKKGTPKTGGRAKGSKNKKTKNIANLRLDKMLNAIGWSWAEEFNKLFGKLDAESKLKALFFLLPYISPQFSELEYTEPQETVEQDKFEKVSNKDLIKLLKK